MCSLRSGGSVVLFSLFLAGPALVAEDKADANKVLAVLLEKLAKNGDPAARLQAVIGLADFGPRRRPRFPASSRRFKPTAKTYV